MATRFDHPDHGVRGETRASETESLHTGGPAARELSEVAPKKVRSRRRRITGPWLTATLLVLWALAALGFSRFMASAKAALESEVAATRAMGVPTTPDEIGAMVAGNGGQNAAPYYVAAINVQGEGATSRVWALVIDGKSLASREAGIEQLRRMGTVLTRLEQATAIERCDFQRDWNQGWEMTLPEYGPMKQFAQLLGARAVVAAERGRSDVAIADLGRMLRISEHVASDPTPIAFLVAHSVVANADYTTQLLANTYKDDVAVLEKINEVWKKAREPDMERAFGSSVPSLRDGLSRSADGRFWSQNGWNQLEVEQSWVRVLASQATVRMGAEIKLLKGHREAIRAMRDERDPRALMDRLSAVDQALESDRSTSGVLGRIMSPMYGSMGHAALKMEAMRRVRIAALDLMIAKARGQDFPERIGKIVDPYDGQPLRYRKEPGGFMFYSIGLDGDNLGTTRAEQAARNGVGSGEDIVWRFPPPARRNTR